MVKSDVSYPKIPASTWWKLRDQFKRKFPTTVTPSYLATSLSMAQNSAQANILGPFKKIGMLDEDGKPTDLANDWRDDNKYPEVCKKIRENNYPPELRDLFPDSGADTSALPSWFMGQTRCGESTAKMYAAFYKLLLNADPLEAQKQDTKQPQAPTVPRAPKRREVSENLAQAQILESKTARNTTPSRQKDFSFGSSPQLHINIQLHISPETTAEQIDRIFASMAKHLKASDE